MDNKLPPTSEAGVAAQDQAPVISGPKRQHFLPRFYLENFSENGLVAVYDRKTDEVRLQQPINTGVIGHFYTMSDNEGRKRFELEQLLSDYEAKAKPVIDKLAARESLDADERANLAIFVALGAMRTPDVVDSVKMCTSGLVTDIMKAMFDNVDVVAARLHEDPAYADKPEHEVRIEAKSMVDMAQTDTVKVTTNHQWAVGLAIEMARTIAPLFAGRDWAVIHRDSDKKSFVTTDAPVLLTTVAPRPNNFWGVGFGNTDALVFFPLKESCTLAMFGNSGDLHHVSAGADRMRWLNSAMASKCQRFLVGRNEALVRSLAKAARLAKTKWQPKMQSM